MKKRKEVEDKVAAPNEQQVISEKKVLTRFLLTTNNIVQVKINKRLEDVLVDMFGGFTNCGGVSGSWKDEDGEIHKDSSNAYEIFLKESEVQALKSLLTEHKEKIGQKTIYFEVCPVDVELL